MFSACAPGTIFHFLQCGCIIWAGHPDVYLLAVSELVVPCVAVVLAAYRALIHSFWIIARFLSFIPCCFQSLLNFVFCGAFECPAVSSCVHTTCTSSLEFVYGAAPP